MAAVDVSYALALRVIGQKLVDFQIGSFELTKWNDDYIVWINREQATRPGSARNALLKKISGRIFGHADSDREPLQRMYFSHQKIRAADLEQQSKRSTNSPKDVRDLGFVLRVVGDYLDRNRAKEFTVSYSPDSVTVRYDQKTELLSVQNLYDFGIRMYLRRSERLQ